MSKDYHISSPESKFVKALASVLPLSESPTLEVKVRPRISEKSPASSDAFSRMAPSAIQKLSFASLEAPAPSPPAQQSNIQPATEPDKNPVSDFPLLPPPALKSEPAQISEEKVELIGHGTRGEIVKRSTEQTDKNGGAEIRDTQTPKQKGLAKSDKDSDKRPEKKIAKKIAEKKGKRNAAKGKSEQKPVGKKRKIAK